MPVIALGANDVARLEAFGAFQQIELHGLTLIERAVAVLLNRGEMYENVLSRGALDKSISLRPVKPLYCSLLSHGKTPFTFVKNCSPDLQYCGPGEPGRPLKENGGTESRPLVPKKSPPK
jgi:hypothetical protein